jgi:hypothetical protein
MSLCIPIIALFQHGFVAIATKRFVSIFVELVPIWERRFVSQWLLWSESIHWEFGKSR